MKTADFSDSFSKEILEEWFPPERSDQFFDALFGDSAEGAFDIGLVFKGQTEDRLHFEFHLNERPGKCLACHLTYGLPDVFLRHPVINANDLVRTIERHLEGKARCTGWRLGATREVSRQRHVIPLIITLDRS